MPTFVVRTLDTAPLYHVAVGHSPDVGGDLATGNSFNCEHLHSNQLQHSIQLQQQLLSKSLIAETNGTTRDNVSVDGCNMVMRHQYSVSSANVTSNLGSKLTISHLDPLGRNGFVSRSQFGVALCTASCIAGGGLL